MKVPISQWPARLASRWYLSATLVGAVIGAGFATGREIVQFFAFHGLWGYAGAALAGYLFFWFGGELTEYQSRKRPGTYGELYRQTSGPIVGVFFDCLTTLFLFAGLSVTLAGLAALLMQQWNLPAGAAFAGAAALCIGIAAFGAQGIVRFNGFIVPVLILLIISLCVAEWLTPVKSPGIRSVTQGVEQLAVPVWAWGLPDRPPTPHWATSALLYFAYNIILFITTLVAVASPSGKLSQPGISARTVPKQPHHLMAAQGRLAGAVIGGLAFILLSVLEPQTASIAELPIPMAGLAASHGPLASGAFALCLALALLTTAVAQTYGTAARLAPNAGSVPLTATAVTLAALPVAALGFVRLLAIVYPAMGLVGLLFALLFAAHVVRWI